MQNKYKVIHIITRLDRGGSAKNTLFTALGMDKKKYEVILIKGPTYESKMSKEEHASVLKNLKEAQLNGVKIAHLSFLIRRISPVLDLLAFISLYLFLIKHRPIIVHTHTSKAGFLGRLAAKLAGIPIIIHTPHGHVFFGYSGPLKSRIFISLEKIASRITDRIVALTNREKEDYLLLKVADEDKIAVIHSGIELNKFIELPFNKKQRMKRELSLPENSLIVGTAGRLVPVKGPEFLLEAARWIIPKNPNAFFIFIGDGDLRPMLEKRASDLGLKDNIIFLGWRDDVAQIISVYDVFVLPSLNEGMGRALVEAMSLGKPIVASNIGGILDLVIHGKNGFLVPPKNPKELAKYIQILLNDKEKREKMGLAGKRMALNFSGQIMLQKIICLYEELLIQKRFVGNSLKNRN